MGEKLWKDHYALLNKDEENELEIFGYKTQVWRRTLCIAGCILSCGALLLLFYWKPEWHVWANCIRCSLEEADVVLLRTTDEFQRYTWKKVTWIDLSTLALHVGSNTQSPLVADTDSVINRAVMKLKMRCIQVQKIRYIWDFSVKEFKKVGSLEDSNTCHSIHHKFGAGLTREEQKIRQVVCGPNAIEVEIRPIWKLLFKEILNPFYVFQGFTLTLWLSQGYIEYSVAIIILTIISIGLTVYDLRQQSTKLHHLVEEHNEVQVTVCMKSEGCKETKSCYLVPGDMFLLDGKKLALPCDAVLIDGSCIVNEGMLTGESIPVTKTPLPLTESPMPWKTHSMEDYRRHVLFCGTEVIQTKPSGKGPVKAVVLQTGFNTAKGNLVRSILYPKPLNFKLYRDAFKFIVGLSVIGVFGLIYTVCVFVSHKKPAADVVAMALLLLTVAVPPAIPTALTTGTVYAQRRLKKKKIFCISPQRINICGQINLVCFDKTGTLTEDGLDLWGVIPSEGSRFQKVHKFPSSTSLPWGPLCGAMATCHSLVILDKKIQGDPLDLKMFEGTHWVVEDSSITQDRSDALSTCIVRPGPKASSAPTEGIAILHQFPFSSALQRMSVVSQKIGEEQYDLYMKGAPETVSSFCRQDTVPDNFLKELKTYTSQGFRVIALAHKVLNPGKDVDVSNLEREDAESELEFLGLLVMENRLKQETKPVLQQLAAARIRSVMVTGDNLQTAVMVARTAGMIHTGSKVILVEAREPEGSTPASIAWRLAEDCEANTAAPHEVHNNTEQKITLEEETCNYHFAMNGKSYQVIIKHFYSLLPKILVNATVFARMSPGQKSSLVEEFQKLDYYVGMCGDGANDCGALKMAHAGISLSEQEASVASPFTSQNPNIQCVPELIREGRAALVASFAVVKYLTLYGLIQFVGTALLFWQLQIFGNRQYLIQDAVITLLVCLTMSLTEAYPKLAPYRPPGQLISPPLLFSIILNVCFTIIMQTCGFLLVRQQPWYVALASQRHCSPGNQTMSNSSPGGNSTSSGSQSNVLSYEDTTLWPLSSINCIIVAFVFSKGKPFRKPIYTNYVFSVLLALQLAVCLFLFFADIDAVYSGMQFLCTPLIWRVYVLLMLLVTFCVSLFTEDIILQNKHLWLLIKAWFGYQSNSQYRKWQRTLQRDPNWPPVNTEDFAAKSTDEIYINPTYEHSDKD
ncbi:probable cation-transporting ATPase 13A5 [Pezoporus occidentalis]|uniref:probable cation-transporting ATPase 13A5 n=1 Tax=Pezoporus occidentalis TaxID=407982 RepID=UPI002F91A8BC